MKCWISLILAFLMMGQAGRSAAEINFVAKNFSGKSGEPKPGRVYDIIEDHRGIIYVADDLGILEYDGLQWRLIVLPFQAGGRALATDRQGRVYVGGEGQIGYLSPDLNGSMAFVSLTELIPLDKRSYLNSHMEIVSIGDEIAFMTDRLLIYVKDRQVQLLVSDSFFLSATELAGKLYLVDQAQGLVRFAGSTLEPIPGGRFFSATTLLTAEDGKIYGASISDGLLELDVNQEPLALRVLSRQDKASFAGTIMTRIRSIDSYLLLGSIGKGLLAYDQKRKESVAINGDYLKDLGTDIYALATDRHQRIWVGTQTGVWVLSPSDSAVVPQGAEPKELDFIAYIRSCVSIKDQKVVFGGAFFQELGGVQTLEASKLNRPELSYIQNSLRFSYASSDLAQAEKVEYQTFLEGQDTDWTEWSHRSYREFTNLMWKNYVFKVRAKHPTGLISEVASFELTILPPWYERYWFYLIQLLILGLLLCLVIYLKGWTRQTQTTDKLNGVIIGTIWGYSFSKVGVQGMVWAMSGGAAFLAIIMNAFMGIFLKPMQKKLEGRMLEFEDRMIDRFQPERAKEKKRQKMVADIKKKPRYARAASKSKDKLNQTAVVLRPSFSRLPRHRSALLRRKSGT